MPDGVQILSCLGWMPGPGESAPIKGIRYLDGGRVADAEFATAHGLGIRRPVLHRGLVEAARQSGVELSWGRRVTRLFEDSVEVGVECGKERINARWVVGADGLKSQIRRWSGLGGRSSRHRRVGVRRHFRIAPWSEMVEVHWADGCEAYVTPVSPEEVGVAMLWSGEKQGSGNGFETLLSRFPTLVDRLAGRPITSRDCGAGPLYHLARRFYSERVALVGDAAGYLDAITGEGLAVGFQQARSLVDALVAADLGLYAREARRLVAFPFLLIRALLLVERRPWLRRRLIAALAADRDLFSKLLAIHARQLEPADLGVAGVARLLGGLLTAS